MRFTHAPGDRPLDNYVIRHALGRGGFGEVYHAVSDGGKEVALKLVQRNLEVELRGVNHCLNLKHPNLVGLYDVKQSENGDHWIVMEYVKGDGLDRVIARNKVGLEPVDVLTWLRGIGDGVSHLHECGIVHRDLKPGNIFLENNVVKIGDYGLAKFISASRRSGQTGSVGTVHYMAPEVVNGRYGKEVDLYAIGVILYEMLTGRVPFDGESPGEILMKHLTVAPDLTPLPPAYRAVVARLLAKDPFQRYSSFKAMLADLDGYLAAPPEGWSPATPHPAVPAVSNADPRTPIAMPTTFTPIPSRPTEKLGFLWYLAAVSITLATSVAGGLLSGFTMTAVLIETSRGRNGSAEIIGVFSGLLSGLLIFGLFLLFFQRWSRSLSSGEPMFRTNLQTSQAAAFPWPLKLLLALAAGTGVAFFIGGLFSHTSDIGLGAIPVGMGVGFLTFGLVTFLLFGLRKAPPFASAAETPPPRATQLGHDVHQTGPWQSAR